MLAVAEKCNHEEQFADSSRMWCINRMHASRARFSGLISTLIFYAKYPMFLPDLESFREHLTIGTPFANMESHNQRMDGNHPASSRMNRVQATAV